MTDLFGTPTPTDDDRYCDRFARIAVERAVDQFPNGLTYGIPADLADAVTPGSRVTVPLGRGNKTTPGWVIDIDIDPKIEPRRIKPIAGREHAPPLPGQMIELAKWMSSYYIAPIGMTLAGMLPAAVRKGIGSVSRQVVSPNPDPPHDVRLAKSQAQLMAWIHEQPAGAFPMDERLLATEVRLKSTGPVRRLIEKGLLTATRRTTIEADWARQAVDTFVPDGLTDEQSSIIGELITALDGGFSTHLLFGVTGSGKTEV
ncbi:MAG: hypothetical protein KC983_08625, partial [Phycisphaerales bacterium]|nr:hypothetical protein [Phycisphaerales bacterium]